MHSRFATRSATRIPFLLACIVAVSPSLASLGEEPTPAGGSDPASEERASATEVDYAKQIRPIFAARCYDCHAEDAQEAGFRIDRKQRALEGGDSGRVILPGNAEESLLYQYVAGLDDVVMPPDDDPLPDDEIALIKEWIDQGAVWPDDPHDAETEVSQSSDHWAFQPIKRPELPSVERSEWVRNEIDRFVLAKLETTGIQPSPEAAPATLMRRLHLDLIGLPPSPEAVEAFELSSQPGAYDQFVADLLASEHYGERWARHWLDVARYSDSDGYEKDRPRPFAWRWRDWVIDALNRDLPFDQFTIEQLAGDLLPNATTDQKIATGFHRNTLINREGGIDPEEDRVKRTVDRTNTTATVWMGLTLRCAQCHSHKYDPFTQREYYRFYAFFDNLEEPDISAPIASEVAAYELAKQAFEAKHKRLQEAVADYEQDQLPAQFEQWEQESVVPATAWQVLRPSTVRSAGGASLEVLEDGSVLADGEAPDTDTYTLEFETLLPEITAIRLEALPDERLPEKGPGRAPNGNFVLGEIKLSHAPAGTEQPTPVEWETATADYSQPKFNVRDALDGKPKTGWGVARGTGNRHIAVFQLKQPLNVDDATRLSLTLEQGYGGRHTLGRIRVFATFAAPPVRFIDDEIALALATPPSARTSEQKEALRDYYQTIDEQLASLRRAVAKHEKKRPKFPEAKAQALAERSEPRTTHVHIRGDFLRPGPEVEPTTPAVLPPCAYEGERPNRLDLARWITSPDNPLTARVIVNRVWQRYFGRGLVSTEDDFGTQGEPPSHPELLDWLASEFMSGGWSLKHLHTLIVTSATYRQSSAARLGLDEEDPENQLLARQNRLRVEGEVIRDLALAVSGLLYPTVGGPSIRPPLPEGVAQLGYANSVKWQESAAPEKYRRGLYIFNQRTVPYPMLTSFDAPDSSVVCTRRERSNTPLQSLTILNDPVFFECAQHLGRTLAERSSDAFLDDDLHYAFRLCLARRPTNREQFRLAELFEQFVEICREDPATARELAGSGDGEEAERQTDVVQTAAWVALGRTLINLDEFVTRE